MFILTGTQELSTLFYALYTYISVLSSDRRGRSKDRDESGDTLGNYSNYHTIMGNS